MRVAIILAVSLLATGCTAMRRPENLPYVYKDQRGNQVVYRKGKAHPIPYVPTCEQLGVPTDEYGNPTGAVACRRKVVPSGPTNCEKRFGDICKKGEQQARDEAAARAAKKEQP